MAAVFELLEELLNNALRGNSRLDVTLHFLHSLNISDLLSDFLALIVLEDAHRLVEVLIKDELSRNLLKEVVAQSLSEQDAHVGYSVANQSQKVTLKELIKDGLLLHETSRAHEHKELTFAISLGSQVFFLEDADDGSLARLFLTELFDNRSDGGAGRGRHSCHGVRQEFEEHRKQFNINSLAVKQLGVVSNVFGEHNLDAPLLLDSLLERLLNVRQEVLSALKRQLFQEDMHIPES